MQRARLPCQSATGAGWLLGCQLMHPISESSALGVPCLTNCACRSPSGMWPLWVISVPVGLWWWCVLLRPYTPRTGPSWSGPLPTGNWVWLENHLSLSIFTVEVPRPEASTPCLDVAPSSATLTSEPKETPSCPVVLSSGPYLRDPTMLTLVNARGLDDTQAPQSRAVNLFSEETMASPYRPTWLPWDVHNALKWRLPVHAVINAHVA